MAYIDLNRGFIPLQKDQPGIVDAGRFWSARMGFGHDWAALLAYKRVVLLAEASSGKTEEFTHQAASLNAQGKAAFFVRIEELADLGFDAALDATELARFKAWKNGAQDGWFFLDSVDEARLNHKSLESALKRFARTLDQSLDRTHIFVSCRVTDWNGQRDRTIIESRLPARERPRAQERDDRDPLLSPIFDKEHETVRSAHAQEEKYADLKVVQLAPLDADQYRALAQSVGVNDIDAFSTAINKQGLDSFTERPGDVLDLADYWKANGRFGPLVSMTEHAVDTKLRELDQNRTDNSILSQLDARHGAERIAAALTFGKSFTLSSPQHGPDAQLADGFVDPVSALPDWKPAEVQTLLRRAIFAPATYGRVRFHHRGTQEYLTACWLNRLMKANLPKAEVWNLMFAERYGVKAVVPSLRPIAAWLALWHPDIAAEIVTREPIVLIKYGDPASIPVETKKALLLAYADKDALADVYDDSVDFRAVWMFSNQALAKTIIAAWRKNLREEFRLFLLRVIREGKIAECVKIARDTALSAKAELYNRIVAVEVLQDLGDVGGLKSLAKLLTKPSPSMKRRFAVTAALAVFPPYLTVKQLLALIDAVPDKSDSSDGFSYQLKTLYDVCQTQNCKTEFIVGLATLVLKQPYVDRYKRISPKHFQLAKGLEAVARAELEQLGAGSSNSSLIRLLMAAERADRHPSIDGKKTDLSELIRRNPSVNRALFWADIEDQRSMGGRDGTVNRHWQVYFGTPTLWTLAENDLQWLEDDARNRPLADDRHVAFSAVVSILSQRGTFKAEETRLRALISGHPDLIKDLDECLAPRTESPEMLRHNQRAAKYKIEQEVEEEKNKESWRKFKAQLEANPSFLTDPEKIRTWKAGAFRLYDLTRWLQYRVKNAHDRAPREWRLLAEGFGQPVAEAYRDGMKMVWRFTKPERPKRTEGNSFTTKYQNILASEAVGLEASLSPDWYNTLSESDAKRAAFHGVCAEREYPDWMDALLSAHPISALPAIQEQLQLEWTSEHAGLGNFLYRLGDARIPIPDILRPFLIDLLLGAEPKQLNTLNSGVRLLRRLNPNDLARKQLMRLARKRLDTHAKADREDWARKYLSMLLVLDINGGLADLEKWLTTKTSESGRVEKTFSALFDRHDPLIDTLLSGANATTLSRLLRLCYSHVRIENDITHEGSYSPGPRDDAQDARNTILSAILDRPGPDAYLAYLNAISDPMFAKRAHRYKELARGKAERDCEIPVWAPAEVVDCERRGVAPIKTGADLLRVVMGVLEDIRLSFVKDDATSKALLVRAQSEEEVQNWLAEQLMLRANGRYHTHREVEVSDGDLPDIVTASTSAPIEVAIEVKHGGKKWSATQLHSAMAEQLAERYLKPGNRRQGILVLSHHGKRGWFDSSTKKRIGFDALIGTLSKAAVKLVKNSWGAIEVRCIGINAASE